MAHATHSTLNRLGKAMALLMVPLLTVSCSKTEPPSVVEWTVLAHRMAGKHAKAPKMFIVRKDKEREFPMPLQVRGFKPQWGVEYTLEVRFDRGFLMFDDVAGMPTMTLQRIITETSRAGTEFRIPSMGAPWLLEDRRGFVDGQSFSCPQEQTCKTLDEFAEDPENRFEMVMRHGEESGLVELLDVIAAD